MSGTKEVADLSKDELRERLTAVEEVLYLQQTDPVAGLELWKAMNPADFTFAGTKASGGLDSTMGSSWERRRRAPTQVAEVSYLEERACRLRRSSAYPHRVLVAMDPEIAKCPAVELKRRVSAVKAEAKRFQTDIKRWRCAIDRDGPVASAESLRDFHTLEEELLEAKLDDLQARDEAFKLHVAGLREKHRILDKHARNVLGERFDEQVPRIMTATDLRAQLKAAFAALRDAKYEHEQRRQAQGRQLSRVDRKIEDLQKTLSDLQVKAAATSDHTQRHDNEQSDAQRRQRRVAQLYTNAMSDVIVAEHAQREQCETAEAACMKIMKADFQLRMLTWNSTNGRKVSDGPEFHVSSEKRTRRR